MDYFEEVFARFVALIRALPEELFLESLNGWSPRDIVAHLVGWNYKMRASCQELLQGKAPSYYADAANEYREINAGLVAEFDSRDREVLLEELLSSRQALFAYLQSLEPGEWRADHGVRHYSGEPATVARIVASLAGDYRDHTRQIEDWVERSRAESVIGPPV